MGNKQAFYEVITQRGLKRTRNDALIHKYSFEGHNQELVSYKMHEGTAYAELLFQLPPIDWEAVRSEAMEGDAIISLAVFVHYRRFARSVRNDHREALATNDNLHKRFLRACKNREMWVYGLGPNMKVLHTSAWVEATVKRRWTDIAITPEVAKEIVSFLS